MAIIVNECLTSPRASAKLESLKCLLFDLPKGGLTMYVAAGSTSLMVIKLAKYGGAVTGDPS